MYRKVSRGAGCTAVEKCYFSIPLHYSPLLTGLFYLYKYQKGEKCNLKSMYLIKRAPIFEFWSTIWIQLYNCTWVQLGYNFGYKFGNNFGYNFGYNFVMCVWVQFFGYMHLLLVQYLGSSSTGKRQQRQLIVSAFTYLYYTFLDEPRGYQKACIYILQWLTGLHSITTTDCCWSVCTRSCYLLHAGRQIYCIFLALLLLLLCSNNIENISAFSVQKGHFFISLGREDAVNLITAGMKILYCNRLID